jgi:hypothetical protein
VLFYRQSFQAPPPPPPPSQGPPEGLVIVTGADEPYMDRLKNLIGSLHFWAPTLSIDIYDLGLSASSRAVVGGFHNVRVRDVDYAALPPHFKQTRLCAFKAWAVLQSLEHAPTVLWLDANLELRCDYCSKMRKITCENTRVLGGSGPEGVDAGMG